MNRILTNWTFTRAAYVLIGVVLCTQALYDRDWAIAILGLYCGGMGVFAIGCASGTCGLPGNAVKSKSGEETMHITND